MVDDVISWVSWLRQRTDLGPVVLAGHSEGGLFAILAAKQTRIAAIQLQRAGMEAGLLAEARNTLATLERTSRLTRLQAQGRAALIAVSVG